MTRKSTGHHIYSEQQHTQQQQTRFEKGGNGRSKAANILTIVQRNVKTSVVDYK